jgi:hypothetical protein
MNGRGAPRAGRRRSPIITIHARAALISLENRLEPFAAQVVQSVGRSPLAPTGELASGGLA